MIHFRSIHYLLALQVAIFLAGRLQKYGNTSEKWARYAFDPHCKDSDPRNATSEALSNICAKLTAQILLHCVRYILNRISPIVSLSNQCHYSNIQLGFHTSPITELNSKDKLIETWADFGCQPSQFIFFASNTRIIQ